jgi:predicted aldo/keto reductase-like oxidoreductase
MNESAQLRENAALADTVLPGSLGEAEHETYRRVLVSFNAAYKVRCTGCGYCMPCPQNVNIPGCFAAYNTSFAMGWLMGMQQYATSTSVTSERTSGPGRCIGCGQCESHCPQHIPIIASLKQVRKRMEPLPIRGIFALARKFLGH